jgi:ATP-binding cassette subfamily B protein
VLNKFVRSYAVQHRRALLVVCALQTVNVACVLGVPYLNAGLIDQGVATGDIAKIFRIGGGMLVISALQMACSIGSLVVALRSSIMYGRQLCNTVVHKILTFSSLEMQSFGVASLLSRSTSDVSQVQSFVWQVTTSIVSPITCAGGIIMALSVDTSLSAIIGVALPVLIVALGAISAWMLPIARVLQSSIDRVNCRIREQIHGIRIIRSLQREGVETCAFDKVNAELAHATSRVSQLQTLMYPTVTLVMNVASIGALWIGGRHIAHGLQIGELSAFIAYLMQILTSTMILTSVATGMPRARAAADRIDEVLSIENPLVRVELAKDSSALSQRASIAGLEFRRVHYRYPRARGDALYEISFAAAPTSVTAIVGATAAGKTTLLDLIPRLIESTSGSILVDGTDVTKLSRPELWKRITIVPQRAVLMSGTIASNLRTTAMPDSDLWRALEITQARDFVAALPETLLARVAPGGRNFSGGQRQRLLLARAILRHPSILLLDDPFSALDVATEELVWRALRSNVKHTTILLASQRISSVMCADQIIVLERGRVVGVGSHTSLLSSCDVYRDIVASQDPDYIGD